MTDDQWKALGYRFWKAGAGESPFNVGFWQRRVFYLPWQDRSDSLGYINATVWKFPDRDAGQRTSYSFEADLDDAGGPLGIRRMTWNPRETTPETVKAIEAEYEAMADKTERKDH